MGLLQQYRSALAEPAYNPPAKIDLLDQVRVELYHALLCQIDPDFPGHPAEDLCFLTGRVELRVGREAQAIALAILAWRHSLVAIEKGFRQQTHQPVYRVDHLLFAFPAMLLKVRVATQIVQTMQLRLVCLRAQRVAVDGDQTRHGAILCFDDLFRRVAALVNLADLITERLMMRSLGQRVLRGPAYQCRWIIGHAPGCLGAGAGRRRAGAKRNQNHKGHKAKSGTHLLTPESGSVARPVPFGPNRTHLR